MKFRTIEFEQLGSTNDEASAAKYVHGDIILTHNQLSGRGQRGNKWQAQPGENLTCTFVIEPTHIPVYEQFMVSMIGALACSDTVRALGLAAEIKWPNDIYIQNRKIGGILIEHHSMGEHLSRSIIGIGLNVNQIEFDPNIPNPTSFRSQGISTNVATVMDTLSSFFAERYAQSINELHRDFMANMYRSSGEFYAYRDEAGEFSARVVGVDSRTGQLALEDSFGVERKYWFKEVEVVL